MTDPVHIAITMLTGLTATACVLLAGYCLISSAHVRALLKERTLFEEERQRLAQEIEKLRCEARSNRDWSGRYLRA